MHCKIKLDHNIYRKNFNEDCKLITVKYINFNNFFFLLRSTSK